MGCMTKARREKRLAWLRGQHRAIGEAIAAIEKLEAARAAPVVELVPLAMLRESGRVGWAGLGLPEHLLPGGSAPRRRLA